jgi:hypothetical protein
MVVFVIWISQKMLPSLLKLSFKSLEKIKVFQIIKEKMTRLLNCKPFQIKENGRGALRYNASEDRMQAKTGCAPANAFFALFNLLTIEAVIFASGPFGYAYGQRSREVKNVTFDSSCA